MFRIPIVSILKTNQILLFENPNIQPPITIQSVNHRRIFNNQHKLGIALVQQVVRQPFLIILTELILGICAKFTVIGWVKEDKVICIGWIFLEESFKVKVFYHGISQVRAYLWRLQIGDLPFQIFFIIRDSPIRNVKFAPAVITEHGSVSIFAHKEEDSGCNIWCYFMFAHLVI